jgi:hypothetical protein
MSFGGRRLLTQLSYFLLCGGLPVSLLMISCGSPGAPAPPSLNLPSPVQDLSVTRTADVVHLTWTMPERTTDRLPIKNTVSAEICRQVDDSPCTRLARLNLASGKPGTYLDTLPPDLIHEPTRLLVYKVRLLNRAGKSAGSSNPAFTAAGPAPAALTGLTYEVRQDGVLLSWHAATQTSDGTPEQRFFRIERTLRSVPKATGKAQGGSPPPVLQTLAVHTRDDLDPGNALDTNAQFNEHYSYTVDRVAQVTVSGHTVELQGQASEPLEVKTTDIFPPSVPGGLEGVADPVEGAIDLSWNPDSDKDLAGYYVYRREPGSSLPASRISPPGAPVPAPAFHDTKVERGHTYAYSVSAIDQSGNESARSPEVEENLPK